MKTSLSFFLPSILLVFAGCNPQNTSSDSNKVEVEVTQKVISFADFKKIKGVDNVQDVPFQLFTKLDSVRFFVAPSRDSAQLTIAYRELDNYYGFEEFDDFYAIHYSIDNNISNSIEAFVLKSEFTAAFDLTLEGLDLYQIRSSMLKASNDFTHKSFELYGTITEVSEQEFKKASKSRVDEVLIQNPSVKLKGENWIYSDNGEEVLIIQHEHVSTEDGLLSNEYIGQSPYLQLEIFKEDPADVPDSYYSFYDVKTATNFELFTGGYPQIIPHKQWISYVSSNSSVGSNFEISKYIAESHKQENLLYVNFTNFKIADEASAFWTAEDSFYVEVYPTNSAPSTGKKQKASFIKIQLKAGVI